jgi:hypothetical protein
MPKYRVNTKSFIGNSVVDEGAVVEYDGMPGLNLDPMDDAAKDAFAQANATRDRKGISVQDLTRQKVASLGGDPEAVELAQAATVAAAAAAAALTGHVVTVDGKPIDGAPAATPPAAPAASGAEGLV